MHLEMIQTHSGFWTVIVDDRFQPMLSPDEALWVCAQALMGNVHQYLRTYEQWKEREVSLLHSEMPEPIAALEP